MSTSICWWSVFLLVYINNESGECDRWPKIFFLSWNTDTTVYSIRIRIHSGLGKHWKERNHLNNNILDWTILIYAWSLRQNTTLCSSKSIYVSTQKTTMCSSRSFTKVWPSPKKFLNWIQIHILLKQQTLQSPYSMCLCFHFILSLSFYTINTG